MKEHPRSVVPLDKFIAYKDTANCGSGKLKQECDLNFSHHWFGGRVKKFNSVIICSLYRLILSLFGFSRTLCIWLSIVELDVRRG